jgi:hypothetical protein
VNDDETDDAAARDADHLRILVVLAFVYAALAALIDVFALIGAWSAFRHVPEFRLAALAVVLRPTVTFVAAIALPFLLRSRASRALCAVAAFLVAWDAPAGTVLGVLVLIVLARRSVALEFEAAASARGNGAADPEAVHREMIRRAARRHARERRDAAAPSVPGTETGNEEPD